jgi:hypothetical protein
MAVKQNVVGIGTLRNAPQCMYAVGIHFSVSNSFGFGAAQMQPLTDVANRCQIQPRLRCSF